MTGGFDDVRFGSSGIRGPFGQRVTPELALALGRAAGGQARRIVVGHDARTTGPALVAAFTAGALAAGADVAHLGLVPTPTLAHAARRYEVGLQVTASHNPAPDNGFKFWEPNGSALSGPRRERLLAALAEPRPLAAWNAQGLGTVDPEGEPAHLAALLGEVGPLDGSPTVVLDCGNGAASRFSPMLLREAGASVITLNAQPDGTFPGRPSEPSAANLGDLAQTVRAADAACGLAHDGDADRGVAVDERGRPVSGDALLVLLARELGAKKIALPVDTSRMVTDALEGVEVVTTPVGDAFVSEALSSQGGAFGGEPSGAIIFPSVSLCPDGPHAVLLAARIAAAHGGLAELVDDLPRYHTLRESLPLGRADRARAMAAVAEALAGLGEPTTLDGVRVDTEDGWTLVRASGTEPKVRVTCEARDEAGAEELASHVRSLVVAALKEASP